MIIHICGAVGSGKTTIGKELSGRNNSPFRTIIVKDLDVLLNSFLKNHKFSVNNYQQFIYDYISKNKKKHIVFVGINQDMGRSKTLYDLESDKKIFINLDVKENVRRRFVRDYKNDVKYFFLWKYSGSEPTVEEIYDMWMKDEIQNTKRLQVIIKEMSPSGLEKDTLRFHNQYKKLGYTFVKPEHIYDKVVKYVSV